MPPPPFGTPIPNSVHAVSVSLPAWQDVIDYEEDSERARRMMTQGYPRFVYHPLVRRIAEEARRRFGNEKENALPLPSRAAAAHCLDYLHNQGIQNAHFHPLPSHGLWAVLFPKDAESHAKAFWQHAGQIVSSRRAEDYLAKAPHAEGTAAKPILTRRIAELSGAAAEDVYLYPSGMATIFDAYRAVTSLKPNAKTIQLGFPYVDTLRVQQRFGAGCHYVRYRGSEDLARVETLLAQEPIAAVFCEFPSNPLLTSVDLKALSALLRPLNVPLVIDDTIATWANADLSPYADIAATSLTKFFSGAGDVMAGSLTLYSHSPLYSPLKRALGERYEDLLYGRDAETLERNSRDFSSRMQRINQATETLCAALRGHPAIAELYYPRYETPETYTQYKRAGGGYGGLFSFILKDESKAPEVYDRLHIAKGPNLGTNYTLACPYTLLAHYRELEEVKASGVSPSLIRVSVGLEDPQELIRTFTQALEL